MTTLVATGGQQQIDLAWQSDNTRVNGWRVFLDSANVAGMLGGSTRSYSIQPAAAGNHTVRVHGYRGKRQIETSNMVSVSVTATPPISLPMLYKHEVAWPADTGTEGVYTPQGVVKWNGEPWLIIVRDGGLFAFYNLTTGQQFLSTFQTTRITGLNTVPSTGGAYGLTDGRLVLVTTKGVAVFNPDFTINREIALPYGVSPNKPNTATVLAGNELIAIREVARAAANIVTVKLIGCNLDTGAIREGAATTLTAATSWGSDVGNFGVSDVTLAHDGQLWVTADWTNGTGQITLAQASPATLALTVHPSWVPTTFHNPIAFAVPSRDSVIIPTTFGTDDAAGTTQCGLIVAKSATDKLVHKSTTFRQAAFNSPPDIHVAVSQANKPLLSVQATKAGYLGNYLLMFNGASLVELAFQPRQPDYEFTQSYGLAAFDGRIYWTGPTHRPPTGQAVTVAVYQDTV